MSAPKEVEAEKSEEKAFVHDEECNDDDCQYIFPQRLMSILGDERNHEAICWLPHGRAFIIRNRKLFAERIMPKFFPRKSKYSSFTRKLNRWNFVRVSSGPELGAYYHEFFLRDKPHLAAQMFCKNARTKIAMASPDPSPASALATTAESQPVVKSTPPKSLAGADPAQLLGLRQQIDPTVQLLLEQQMGLGQQHMNTQMRQQQLQQQSLLSILQGTNSSNAPTALMLEIQRQKQQQERLIQLQQLMSLQNLKRQQQRKNNFRASAA